jgi:hypothetical protein
MWIFQANPKLYNLLGALADANLDEDVWKVTRYKREICLGHIALIWMSGKERGIYAVVDVTSNTQPLVESPQSAQYWIHESDRFQEIDRVKIHRALNLRGTPILEEELIRIPQLQNMQIFGFRHATNFKVEDDERLAILDLLRTRFRYVP